MAILKKLIRSAQSLAVERGMAVVPRATAGSPPATRSITTPMPSIAGEVARCAERIDRLSDPSRLGGPGPLHATSLLHECNRAQALARLYPRPSPIMESVNANQRVLWALGRAAEAHLRKSFIRGRNFAGIYGIWKCDCQKSVHPGAHPGARKCAVCLTGLDNYHEMKLTNAELMVEGNPDLMWFAGDDYLVVTEIKSIAGEHFKELDKPKGDHATQALIYRRLLELDGYKVHRDVIIVYVNKHFQFTKTPYKQYEVDSTTPLSKRMVKDALDNATIIKSALSGGPLPPRCKGCATPSGTKAKGCKVAVECFSV
jgi:hypothetical protein